VSPEKLLHNAHGMVLFREPFGTIANNQIYATPRHPVLRFSMEAALSSLLRRDNDSIWSKTGPGLLTRAAASYILEVGDDVARKNLVIKSHQDLLSQVQIHIRMSYKSTVKYWNAKNTSVPGPLRRVAMEYADPHSFGDAA